MAGSETQPAEPEWWLASDGRWYPPQTPAPEATITLTRPRAWYGRARALRIFIDGSLAGRIHAGQTLWFPVAKGEHRVRVKMDWTGSREVAVTVPPDPQLTCGPRGLGFAYMFVKPSRSLLLESAASPDPGLSPLLTAAGVVMFVIYIGLIVFITNRLFGG